jgi:hypothetical protein
MFDQFGGRKAVVALVALFVGVGVTIYVGDVPPNLLSLIEVLFGAFVVGNGVEHVANTFGAVSAQASMEAPQPSPTAMDATLIESRLNELQSVAIQTQEAVGFSNQALTKIISIATGQPTK